MIPCWKHVGFVVVCGGLLVLATFYHYTEQISGVESTSIRYWRHSRSEAESFASKNVQKHLKLKGHKTYRPTNLSYDYIKAGGQSVSFAINNSADVLVFLHIQKTAGTTFEKSLVYNLDLSHPCKCAPKGQSQRRKCQCLRPNSVADEWLFSRYSTGWQCGLHADWTELVVSNCVDRVLDERLGYSRKRRYFYTTFLREPISRFISEFRHVQRGATWRSSPHVCNGRPPSPEELPMCFDPDRGWKGVTLAEYLDCPYNLAFNRQTRMLADLTLVGCYNQTGIEPSMRDGILLESAKKNLAQMAFFGLQSQMRRSQYVFERTFGLQFKKSMANWNISKSEDTTISHTQMDRIEQLNQLDVQLYQYAEDLFKRRFQQLSATDPMYTFNIS